MVELHLGEDERPGPRSERPARPRLWPSKRASALRPAHGWGAEIGEDLAPPPRARTLRRSGFWSRRTSSPSAPAPSSAPAPAPSSPGPPPSPSSAPAPAPLAPAPLPPSAPRPSVRRENQIKAHHAVVILALVADRKPAPHGRLGSAPGSAPPAAGRGRSQAASSAARPLRAAPVRPPSAPEAPRLPRPSPLPRRAPLPPLAPPPLPPASAMSLAVQQQLGLLLPGVDAPRQTRAGRDGQRLLRPLLRQGCGGEAGVGGRIQPQIEAHAPPRSPPPPPLPRPAPLPTGAPALAASPAANKRSAAPRSA